MSYEDHLGNLDEVLAFNAATQKMRIEKMQEKTGMRGWTTGRSVEHVLNEITEQNRKIQNLYSDYLQNIYQTQTKNFIKEKMSRHFIHTANFAFFGWCKTQ
ncbi:hypothetical protein QIT55_gp36 [Nitrosopumilus spindle-shaped virus]|uniref:Uncharacterized protein n=1 Tax=Nitrosopumilus spindle-shaped virus 1 TaxID=2848002 RepID=A0A514K4F6_9VIRU|nr:hypothetical protein QIT55_gp36 [Nitrosopumilus spindle-shaped virus]QDI74022.1 hypothetical protein [Nitrosopumilus spindle-shaped virus]